MRMQHLVHTSIYQMNSLALMARISNAILTAALDLVPSLVGVVLLLVLVLVGFVPTMPVV